jgi:hypothetical protein
MTKVPHSHLKTYRIGSNKEEAGKGGKKANSILNETINAFVVLNEANVPSGCLSSIPWALATALEAQTPRLWNDTCPSIKGEVERVCLRPTFTLYFSFAK